MQDIIAEIKATVSCKACHLVFTCGPSTYGIVLILLHSLKPNHMDVVVVAQPIHKIGACYADSHHRYLHAFVSI
jgi:hypothetical protein